MQSRTIIAITGAAAIAVGATCVAHPGHPPLPTPTITIGRQQAVPFVLFRGNRIIVPATINGHQAQVMLDTGASLTTFDRNYARSIGLPEGFKIQAKGSGGATDAELVTGLTLELGGLKIADASAGVMDLEPIERSIGRPITAIFGRDIFNAGVISIDWAKKQLIVQSRESFKPAAGATEVTLTKKGPFNTIPISIAGASPIEALLDLGNGAALTLPGAYWHERPELSRLRSAAADAGGVGGMHAARAAIVPQVTLAGASLTAVPAILSESGNNDDPEQMANVGIGLLKQFKVDLDLGRGRIFLAPRSDRTPFDRDRSGARFTLEGDRLRAAFVSPEGPAAAAGLKTGDEIVSVDGRAVRPGYYQARDWTRGPAGRKVVLARSDGSKLMVTLADYY